MRTATEKEVAKLKRAQRCDDGVKLPHWQGERRDSWRDTGNEQSPKMRPREVRCNWAHKNIDLQIKTENNKTRHSEWQNNIKTKPRPWNNCPCRQGEGIKQIFFLKSITCMSLQWYLYIDICLGWREKQAPLQPFSLHNRHFLADLWKWKLSRQQAASQADVKEEEEVDGERLMCWSVQSQYCWLLLHTTVKTKQICISADITPHNHVSHIN